MTEALAFKTEAIQQERLETQNVVIVRYWQMSRLDRLYDSAKQEEAEDRQVESETNSNSLTGFDDSSSQLSLEAPPDYRSALAKLPVYSLGELDQSLHQIRESRKDMIEASDGVIDPLLDQWTLWQDVREQKEKRESTGSGGSGRYAPSVQNLYEEEQSQPNYFDLPNHEEAPRGKLLEGTTTNWRQPHSVEAKQKASHLRKQYSNYQPSVSVDSSEVEDEDRGKRSKNRIARHHVVDSSSESSDSEPEAKPRRRRQSSGTQTTEKKLRFPESPALPQSYGPSQSTFGGRYTVSPGVTPGSTPWSPVVATRNISEPRPNPTPNQGSFHHSVSSPLPPIHTSNAPNPYAAHHPYSPNLAPPPYNAPNGQTYPPPVNRYMPPQAQRIPSGPRPGSQDGKTRSPSRMSVHSSSSRRSIAAEQSAVKVKKDRTVYKSATKGILGAGGIAMFLDALEGLDV